MKNIEQMAHEYALEMLKRGDPEHKIPFDAFELAEAMQAEAKKREDKSRPGALNDFEVDWSQAPDDARSYHIELDEIDGSIQPFWTDSLETYFDGEMFVGYKCAWNAPSFGYQGDWRDSLRKRP